MGYATADDLRLRLPEAAIAQLLSEASDDESVVEDAIDAVLVEAQGRIDSKLASVGYLTPVDEPPIGGDPTKPTPDMITLKSHTLSIAKYLALSRRGMSAYDPAAEKLYNSAEEWLKRPVLADAPLRTIPSPTSTRKMGSGSDTRVYGENEAGQSSLKGL